MAHFLEHLVFKGGEKYDDYRKVNETAERMGAVLNAYTSHDLVAFHITCRAEVARRGDRPADRLRRAPEDRRRGARPRARRRDPGDRALQRPAVGRRRAPDRPRRVRRPPARAPRARARRSTCARSRARRSSSSARRQWAGARGGAFLVGNLDSLPDDAELADAFCRFPSIYGQRRATSPRRRSRRRRSWRSATPTSRTCGCPTGPTSTPRDLRSRAALTVYSTLLGGSMGSRLFDEIREQRGLAYSVYSLDHVVRRRADPAALRGPGVRQVRRGLHAHARDRRRAARGRAQARRSSSGPRPTRPAAACWRSRTPTPSPATPPPRPSSSARTSTPTPRSRRSTRRPSRRSPRSRAGSPRSSRWPAWARTRSDEFA